MLVHAIRARHAFDGRQPLPGGATVVVDGGRLAGVEAYGFEPPGGCPVTESDGTLLPGLVDAHAHLVCDSGPDALTRVAGRSRAELDEVITAALRDQLAAGVTVVRDLGDRDFAVVDRRDAQRAAEAAGAPRPEPTIVASGPPITCRQGHCFYLGGEVDGDGALEPAVAERVRRGVDVVKVMASGGVNTPGTDVRLTQFGSSTLRRLVDLVHGAGLPITAHAHGTAAVEQAVACGVDGVEHCSCVTEHAFGDAPDLLVDAIADRGVVVCPTLGIDPESAPLPPPQIVALAASLGCTVDELRAGQLGLVRRLHARGARIISGVDSGIQPAKRHGTLPYSVLGLLEADLPLADALATATSEAARACGLGDRKGRLAAGFDADLLLVAGDLTTDPTALARPDAVWLHGERVT